jgi:hypothetical protein
VSCERSMHSQITRISGLAVVTLCGLCELSVKISTRILDAYVSRKARKGPQSPQRAKSTCWMNRSNQSRGSESAVAFIAVLSSPFRAASAIAIEVDAAIDDAR